MTTVKPNTVLLVCGSNATVFLKLFRIFFCKKQMFDVVPSEYASLHATLRVAVLFAENFVMKF